MPTFFNYSKYYDLLYRDKPYTKEVDYIDSLIKKFQPQTRQILDVGCGTGIHARALTAKGYTVHGVDLSPEMLKIANQSVSNDLTFSQGNIQNFDLGRQFDTISSLFHVMSYQTTNDEVMSSFKTIHKHLIPGGLFIFDCWYGPGVLSDLPGLRVKEMEDDALKVIRITRPVTDVNKSTVEVNFDVNVFDKSKSELQHICEKHLMRYFFLNELDLFCQFTEFNLIGAYQWLTTNAPDKTAWYITVVCRKQ